VIYILELIHVIFLEIGIKVCTRPAPREGFQD